VGGLAVIMIFVLVFLYFLRKRRKAEVFKEEPNFTRYHPDDAGSQLHQQNMTAAPISRPPHSYPTHSPPHTSNATSLRQNVPSRISAASLLPAHAEDAADHDAGATSHSDEGGHSNLSSTNFRASLNIPNQLTEEQAEYVQNMYSLRVPVPAIAAVVERMLREGDVPVDGQGSSTPVETSMARAGVGAGIKRGSTTVTKPPSYRDS
jgi:hypothetical protein